MAKLDVDQLAIFYVEELGLDPSAVIADSIVPNTQPLGVAWSTLEGDKVRYPLPAQCRQ